MMIKSLLCVLTVFFIMSVGCSRAFDYPEAKITIKIIDESGNPLDAVNASISFELPKSNGHGIKDVAVKGITGVDGIFSAMSRTSTNIAYSAEKQGYYKSYGEYQFTNSTDGRWQPWNPEFKLVLRKLDNPVPMYSRNAHVSPIKVPALRKSVGFDLIEFDWVSPYGNGKHSDFIIKLDSVFNSEVDFKTKFELTFPNQFDGIQIVKEDRTVGSELKLPRIAPETGYQNKLIRSRSRAPGAPGENDQRKDNNYIFRIRSEEKNGKLIRAMYGKIHGDIFIDPPSSIYFKYYLNPDYTGNLEFNPQRNLFENIPRGERIGLD